MPVEIRELLIQAKVNEDHPEKKESAASQEQSGPQPDLAAMRESIIRECMDRVHQMLEKKRIR